MDDAFPQLLLLVQHAHTAAERIYQSIVHADPGPKRLLPVPEPYHSLGSTAGVDFDTVKPTWPTRADKSHISEDGTPRERTTVLEHQRFIETFRGG